MSAPISRRPVRGRQRSQGAASNSAGPDALLTLAGEQSAPVSQREAYEPGHVLMRADLCHEWIMDGHKARQCSKKGVVDIQGVLYCKQHAKSRTGVR